MDEYELIRAIKAHPACFELRHEINPEIEFQEGIIQPSTKIYIKMGLPISQQEVVSIIKLLYNQSFFKFEIIFSND